MKGPKFFVEPDAFRAWLAEHHGKANELLVGFHKKPSRRASITWKQSVDKALCFGWIDGVRRRIDDDSYSIRFTPRRPGSTWSAVNIARVAALEAEGLMQPAGREAFAARSAKKSRTYSYERTDEPRLEPSLHQQLVAAGTAWQFLRAQAPSYLRKVLHWVASAKGTEVRQRRLDRLLEAAAKGCRL